MYADVLVPLPLAGRFTYLLPETFTSQVKVGSRVVVPFGLKRHYAGIVTRLHNDAPAASIKIKEVASVIDPYPIILPTQLSLWQWMAEYYLCAEGDVMKAALPSGFNLAKNSLEQYYRPRTDLRISVHRSVL